MILRIAGFLLLLLGSREVVTVEPHGAPLVVVSVSDISELMDAGGDEADLLMGYHGASSELKLQLGEALGDPKLEGLPPGADAVVYVWQDGDAMAFVSVSPTTIDSYVSAINGRGGHASRQAGLLAVKIQKQPLRPMTVADDVVRKDLPAPGTGPAISARMDVADFLADHDAQLDGWISSLVGAAVANKVNVSDTSGQALLNRHVLEQTAEVWFRSYLAILKRIDAVELALKFPEGGLRADLVFGLVEGSEPAGGVAEGSKLLGLLAEDGAIRGQFVYDTAARRRFYQYLAGQVAASMGVAPAKAAAWKALLTSWVDASDGAVAFCLMQPDVRGFNATYAVGIKSPDECLKMLRGFPQRLTQGGLVDLYAGAGVNLNLEFQENRRLYGGVAVHRMIYRLDITNREQLPLSAMDLTDLSADVAIVRNVMLLAMGSADINLMIDNALAGMAGEVSATNAARVLDDGARFRMDYDLVQVFSGLARVLPPNRANIFRNYVPSRDTTSSLSIAGYSEEDQVRLSFLFPTDLIAELKSMSGTSRTTGPEVVPGFMESPSNQLGAVR